MSEIRNVPAVLNIVSEVELVYHSAVPPSQRPIVKRSEDSYRIFRLNWNENKIGLLEQFKVIFLNCAARVLAIIELSSGGTTATIADPKLVFATALKLNATAIVLAHNHPSGNLEPSKYDLSITERLKNAGSFLDIQVFDHIILTTEGYYSFADNGLL